MQEGTVFVRDRWFEVEVTDCRTWVTFTNSEGTVEANFYNDDEGARDMDAWMVE